MTTVSRFFLYTMILISIVFSISICVGTVGSTNAQRPTSDQFLNYTSSTEGFKITYPSNWEVKEDGLISPEDVVQFKSPEDKLFASLMVGVQNASSYLDTDAMTLKNATAEDYGLKRLNTVSVMGQPDANTIYKKIRSNEFPVDGHDGWKIEYIWGYLLGFYNLEVFTVSDGKLYTLRYMDTPLKVPETLPVVNKIIESFQTTK